MTRITKVCIARLCNARLILIGVSIIPREFRGDGNLKEIQPITTPVRMVSRQLGRGAMWHSALRQTVLVMSLQPAIAAKPCILKLPSLMAAIISNGWAAPPTITSAAIVCSTSASPTKNPHASCSTISSCTYQLTTRIAAIALSRVGGRALENKKEDNRML